MRYQTIALMIGSILLASTAQAADATGEGATNYNRIIAPGVVPLSPNDANSPVAAELMDGTQAIFRSDGSINVVMPNGKYVVPPDGVLTLKDGTTFNVEGGKRTQ